MHRLPSLALTIAWAVVAIARAGEPATATPPKAPNKAANPLPSGPQKTGASPDLCNPGAKVSYYQSGALKDCGALKDYYLANGIKCNKYGPAGFYEKGALKNCILVEPLNVDGKKCNAYGPISFYENGKLEACVKPVEKMGASPAGRGLIDSLKAANRADVRAAFQSVLDDPGTTFCTCPEDGDEPACSTVCWCADTEYAHCTCGGQNGGNFCSCDHGCTGGGKSTTVAH